MPNIRQEKFCRDELDRWLRGKCPCATLTWRRGDEPPDFWLTMEGIEYAVEVTRILNEQDRKITTSLWRIIKRAESKALDEGILSGTYEVEFYGPIKTFRNWDNILIDKILGIVRETGGSEYTEGEVIVANGQILCKIQKQNNQNALIDCIEPDNNGGWEHDVEGQLQPLLQKRIEKKSEFPRNKAIPTILILYDLFGLASRELFVNCLASVDQVRLFEIIYVVQDRNIGYLAYKHGARADGAAEADRCYGWADRQAGV